MRGDQEANTGFRLKLTVVIALRKFTANTRTEPTTLENQTGIPHFREKTRHDRITRLTCF